MSEIPSIEIPVQIMFFDTDCAGVVHNIAYLRFIETARTLLAEDLGWKLTEMGSTGLYPVVVRTEIDYRRPAKLGDTLLIHGCLAKIERSRFWVDFRVTRKTDDLLMVTCSQVLAVVRMPEGKPVRLPGDWGTRFASLMPSNPAPAGSGVTVPPAP